MDLVIVSAPFGVDRTPFMTKFVEELVAEEPRNVVVLRSDEKSSEISLKDESSVRMERIEHACVSCSIKADLVSVLREMARSKGPEVIVFETDSRSRPATVMDAVKDCVDFPIGSITTIVVLDSGLFTSHQKAWEQILEHQISEAELVVIYSNVHIDQGCNLDLEKHVRSLGFQGFISHMMTDNRP